MQWETRVVTGIQSLNNLIIDRMPRHILDLRQVKHANDEGMENDHEDKIYETLPAQRLQRERNAQIWTQDYIM